MECRVSSKQVNYIFLWYKGDPTLPSSFHETVRARIGGCGLRV